MREKTRWITRTAAILALLLGVQFFTRSLGQLVTGTGVNLLLALSLLCGGWWCGFTVALLSPLLAFLMGVGPALLPLVPAISAGNIVLVAALRVFCKSPREKPGLRAYAAAVAASVLKFAALYLMVAVLLIPALSLPEKQAAAMSAMFTWPQLVTALIGSLLAATVAPLINRAGG